MNRLEEYLDRLRIRLERYADAVPRPEAVRFLDEAREHLKDAVRELEDAGRSREDAERLAIERFGPAESVAAALNGLWASKADRKVWYASLFPSGGGSRQGRFRAAWEEIRMAARTLRRRPAVTLLAVLTLSVGLGSISGLFRVADYALLRSVPGVEDPGNLSVFWYGIPQEDGSFRVRRLSYPNLHDMRARLESLSDIAGFQSGSCNVALDGAEPEALTAGFVTANFFDVLGARPILGRDISPEEDDPSTGGAPVAVISHRLWRSRLGSDPALGSRAMWVNGRRTRIIGVAPPGFHGTERTDQTDVWMPGASQLWVRHFSDDRSYSDRARGSFYEFVGRLAPGWSWAGAEAELNTMLGWLSVQYPEANGSITQAGFRRFDHFGAPPLGNGPRGGIYGILLASVGLVLLVACANVANLLLADGLRRRPEIAVRRSLGAGTGHLVRQHLLEGLLIWSLGGILGLWVAALFPRALSSVLPGAQALLRDGSPFRGSVLLFTGAVTLLTGLVFSVYPAMQGARVDPVAWLKAGGGTDGTRPGTGRSIFPVMQLAVVTLLTLGALLFIGSVRNLAHVDLGFAPEGVVTLGLNLSEQGYDAPRREAYVEGLKRAIERLPGARMAVCYNTPFLNAFLYTRIRPAGSSEEVAIEPMEMLVSPGWFELLGITIRRGRGFLPEDSEGVGTEGEQPLVLSEGLARALFGGTDPLGRLVEFPVRGQEDRVYRVVGVAADLRAAAVAEESRLIAYRLLETDPMPGRMVVLAGGGPGAGLLAETIRSAARELDPTLPVAQLTRLSDRIDQTTVSWDLMARLLSAMSVLTLMLAGIGLYGIVSADLGRRRREMGIRLALGASAGGVVLMLMERAGRMTLMGLVLGGMGAAAVLRFVESRLYGIHAYAPGIWLLAISVVCATVVVASLRPVWQAIRTDPADVLRSS